MKRLAFAAVLAAAFPLAAIAGQAEDDYLAARTKAVAAIAAAEAAKKDDATLEKLDESGRKGLETRMTALLGPVRFKGLSNPPTFSPSTLSEDSVGAFEPDGLLFSDDDGGLFILVSPEPIFSAWLKRHAADEGAPEAFKDGIAEATATDDFYTYAIGMDAAFDGYTDLEVAAKPGETLSAVLGLWTQDISGNEAPNRIVVTRVADGRVYVGSAQLKTTIPAIPACDEIWKGYADKAEALRKAAEKTKKDDDPRWEEAGELDGQGSDAYRTCFAEKAAGQPFLADVTKEAEALLETIRGN